MFKKTLQLTIVLSFILLSFVANAQEGYRYDYSDNILIGNWKVTETIKKESSSSTFCGLSYHEFKVTKDSISFAAKDSSKTISYSWNREKDIYKIMFKNGAIDFQLYFAGKYVILHNLAPENDCILLLERED